MANLQRLFLVVFLVVISINSYGQKPPIKLGDVSRPDIEMKNYELDPGADAVVLCDYGYLSFDFNTNDGRWENHLKRICRIKILNDDGYNWATEEISLYDDSNVEQSISQIKGFTYNIENGKVQKTKLEKRNIFTEKTSKNYKRVKFTLPNAKEGSVIEFSYTIHSNYLTILDRWKFQRTIPVKWSEYIVNIPEYLTYLKNSQGFASFHKFETNTKPRSITWTNTQRTDPLRGVKGNISTGKMSYIDKVFHWIAKDLPGLKDEKFVGNINNYHLGVDFQLSNYKTFSDQYHNILSSWDKIVKRFMNDYENFGPNMKKRSFYKDVTEKIMAEYSDPIRRSEAVYNFVSQHMKWDKKERFMPGMNIKKSFDERTGNSADINALLVSMLKAVEVQADPVILSTLANGMVHPVNPIIDKYNYLIARAIIDGKVILMDATEKDLPFGMLPMRCLNQRGYAISERNPGWVNLKPLKGIDETVVCAMNLGENGVMYGSIAARYDGYSAINMRNRLKQDGKEKYIENFKSNHTDWSIQSIEVDAPDVCGEPVNEKIEIEVNRPTEVIGKMIYITPILRGKLEENPLKQNERKLPIELIVPIKHSYMFSFVIPEGYKVDELPQSINLVTPDHTAILKYGIQLQGNRLHLVHSWQIKESFYAPDKFHDLKEFYAILVSKHNEQIVLKKVESN